MTTDAPTPEPVVTVAAAPAGATAEVPAAAPVAATTLGAPIEAVREFADDAAKRAHVEALKVEKLALEAAAAVAKDLGANHAGDSAAGHTARVAQVQAEIDRITGSAEG